jgi:3-hydroxybutyryl-CoA dehydrogenase
MSDIQIIGVLGAGQMGSGIAQVAARRGGQVRLADASLELAERAAGRSGPG